MVSPAEFIPIAEDTGLINELGDWVLQHRLRRGRDLAGPHPARRQRLAGPAEMPDAGAEDRRARSPASGLTPSRLELEITEAVLIRDDEAALAILHQLRAIGVRIALDDFGTGYSSLSYLKRFPFDKIKIDRCFVSDIAEVDGSSAIVQAVVNIAAARNMTTTAEGVETESASANRCARSAAPRCRAICSPPPSRGRGAQAVRRDGEMTAAVACAGSARAL